MRRLSALFFVLFDLAYHTEAWWFGKSEGQTTVATNNVTTQIADSGPPHADQDLVQYEIGTIIGVIFGIIFGVVLISFAGYMYVKQKRERDREYTMKTRVKMMSSRHAGVYMDTTTQEKLVPDNDFTLRSPVYKSCQKFQNPHEDDSDDELWTSSMRG